MNWKATLKNYAVISGIYLLMILLFSLYQYFRYLPTFGATPFVRYLISTLSRNMFYAGFVFSGFYLVLKAKGRMDILSQFVPNFVDTAGYVGFATGLYYLITFSNLETLVFFLFVKILPGFLTVLPGQLVLSVITITSLIFLLVFLSDRLIQNRMAGFYPNLRGWEIFVFLIFCLGSTINDYIPVWTDWLSYLQTGKPANSPLVPFSVFIVVYLLVIILIYTYKLFQGSTKEAVELTATTNTQAPPPQTPPVQTPPPSSQIPTQGVPPS